MEALALIAQHQNAVTSRFKDWATVGMADIESANVVGYASKDTPAATFAIYIAPFEAVAGGTDVNTLLSTGVSGVDYAEDAYLTAAQIQVPNASGYTTLYYFNDGWYDDGTEEGALKAGWCDSDGYIVDLDLIPGVSFWFKSVSAVANPTIAGAVPGTDKASIDCPTGFALRANTYPVAIDVNDGKMTSSDIVGVDYAEDAYKSAPQIQIPNASGYTTLYYFNDGWYDDGTEEGALKAGWCDSDGYIVDATIPVMQGFWTKGVTGAFTLTFVK